MPTTWTGSRQTLPPELARLGVDITSYQNRGGGSYRRIEPAATDVVVIIGYGADTPWRIAAPSKPSGSHQAFAAGLAMWPLEASSEKPFGCVEVRLPPPVSRVLFQTTISGSDGAVDLTDLLGREDASLLVDSAARANDPQGIVADVVRLPTSRLADGSSQVRPEIDWAWRRIAVSGGRISVRALADEIGWSERHLTGLFRNDIGLAPKAAARLTRFALAHRRVLASADSLASIAADSGFSDQSHMNREFKALSGASPAALRNALLPEVVFAGEASRK